MLRLLSLILFLPSLASASYWVSVGSFQQTQIAQDVATQASARLDGAFVLQATPTPDGEIQRVVTGPFASRDAAARVQQQAQSGGYPDSLIFYSSVDEASGDLPPLPQLDTTYSGNVGYDDAMPQSAPTPSGFDSPEVRAAIESGKLPTKIPPGYQLNSLFRDGAPHTAP